MFTYTFICIFMQTVIYLFIFIYACIYIYTAGIHDRNMSQFLELIEDRIDECTYTYICIYIQTVI
jgi:hypothetical protein